MAELLTHGADKVSVNTAALEDPELITRCAEVFGSKCGVLAIDAKRRTERPGWEVFSHGGRRATGRHVVEWWLMGEKLGAVGILLTSMDNARVPAGDGSALLSGVETPVHLP